MSKAFTKESDDDMPVVARKQSPLPPGANNYLTAGGVARLREELEQLQSERSEISKTEGDKGRLASLEQEIEYLETSLGSAVVTEAPPEPWDVVRFGATVTVRDNSGETVNYRIVGADETDIDRDWVSWFSPIGRALMGAKLGERVKFRVPAGPRELEITGIDYE